MKEPGADVAGSGFTSARFTLRFLSVRQSPKTMLGPGNNRTRWF